MAPLALGESRLRGRLRIEAYVSRLDTSSSSRSDGVHVADRKSVV